MPQHTKSFSCVFVRVSREKDAATTGCVYAVLYKKFVVQKIFCFFALALALTKTLFWFKQTFSLSALVQADESF